MPDRRHPPGNVGHEPSQDEIDAVYAAQGLPNVERRRQSFITHLRLCVEDMISDGGLERGESYVITTSAALDLTVSPRWEPMSLDYPETGEQEEAMRPIVVNNPTIEVSREAGEWFYPRFVISGQDCEKGALVRLAYDPRKGHEIYTTDHPGRIEAHKQEYRRGVANYNGKLGFRIS